MEEEFVEAIAFAQACGIANQYILREFALELFRGRPDADQAIAAMFEAISARLDAKDPATLVSAELAVPRIVSGFFSGLQKKLRGEEPPDPSVS